MKDRKHYRYELKDGRKVVYKGITTDPARREKDHKLDGKRFSHMRTIGPAVTKEAAEKWEKDSLACYRRNHRQKNPKYNVAKNGRLPIE